MGYTSKYKGAEIDALLDKVEALPEGGNGGGVPIVSSIEELEALNLPIGSVVSVGKEGNLSETSVRNLYQPTADILDSASGSLTTPELLSSVADVRVLAPEGVINGESCGFVLVPRSFSFQNLQMLSLFVECVDNVVGGIAATSVTSKGEKRLVLATYTNGVPTMNQTASDELSDILYSGEDWCYLGFPEAGFVMTDEQFNLLDNFFRVVSGVPSFSSLFVKKEEGWKEFALKEELDKLTSQFEGSRIKLVDVSPYQNTLEMKPNVYYRLDSTYYNLTVSLLEPTELDIANEYMFEIHCSNEISLTLPTELVWANGLAPEITKGKSYVISIVNNLAVFAEF